jgi:hypothetical protein
MAKTVQLFERETEEQGTRNDEREKKKENAENGKKSSRKNK